MGENRKATERNRQAEEKMIEEAKRAPAAFGQGRDEEESGADSARGMQTGAEDDLTRTEDGSPAGRRSRK